MNLIKLRHSGFLILVVLALLSGSINRGYAAALCQGIFEKATSAAVDTTGRLYAKGIDSTKTPNGHFQISFESEYLFSESGRLLRDYAPAEDVMKKTDWLALTDDQRIDWIKSKFGDKPAWATAAGLRRIVDVDFLPQELIVDSTGNLEIVINPPLDTYADWERVVDYVGNKYGVGSQQAMLSKPREAAFTSSKQVKQKINLEQQHLGWLYYTNLYDMFEKLDNGYQRYQKDATKLTAQFFEHPFLGPMVKMKRDMLEEYLNGNAKMEYYDENSKKTVVKLDRSFKYTGGPAYRPDIAGPVRWAWEIRNAHKDLKGLKAKVRRDVEAHSQGLDAYQKFSQIPAFDSIAEFEKFPADVKTLMTEVFPTRADPRFNYHDRDRIVLETYRHFSMPLADAEVMIRTLSNEKDFKANLARAKKSSRKYLKNIKAVATEYSAKRITEEQARAQVQGLLCTWSVEAGIYKLFQSEATHIAHDKRMTLGNAGDNGN